MLAITWMTGTLASFCLMAISIRELSGEIPVFQMLFVRSFIGLIFVLAILHLTRQTELKKSQKVKLHLFRNIFQYAGQYGWYLGIGLLPLAEVFALEFTIPFWTVIIAAIFLNEKITSRKVISIVLGLAGVIVIVQPGIEIVDAASLIVLAAAVCFAVGHSANKKLSATDKPVTILYFMCLLQAPFALLMALFSWVWPDSLQWLWLISISLTALSAHYCLTKAMQTAEVSMVVTLDFLRLPLIAIVGVFLYQEQFEFAILLGGALMLLGNLVNLQRKEKSIPQEIEV